MINYKKQQLDNGITVITAPMHETKAVSVLVIVKVGSRYETEGENGISHFLEHMFFKGTKNRPTTLHISQELDKLGANFNAFTSEEYTGFYVSSSADHFDISVDILSDMLLNSLFDQNEINKESGVILEEINMYNDMPKKLVQDLAKENLYGNTPLGRSTLGRAQIIKKLKRDNFLNYINTNYTGANTIIAVAGNPVKFDWLKIINDKFKSLKKGTKNKFETQIEKQESPKVFLHYKKTDQAHLLLNLRTFDRFNNDRHALMVGNNLFGGMMSSRLFTEIREKRGLAYYVGSGQWEFDDCGALCISAGLDKNRIDEALKVIIEEISKLKNQKISDEEINKSKENIKGGFYLGLEDSFSIAEFLAEQELLKGKIEQPEEILDKVFKTNNSQIFDIANKYFIPKNLNLTIIGPYKDTNRFEKLLKI
jgi:predicted Zn-dependent peptidase